MVKEEFLGVMDEREGAYKILKPFTSFPLVFFLDKNTHIGAL